MKPIPAQAFSQVLKSVGLLLGRYRFERKGASFRRHSDECLGIISVQRSRYNSAQEVKFTINVGVVCYALLEHPVVQPQLDVWDSHVFRRLGHISPINRDLWWTINETTNIAALTEEVGDLIERYAVPFVDRYLDPREIVRLWESGESPGQSEAGRIMYLKQLKLALNLA